MPVLTMCRSIHNLFDIDTPVTMDDITAASLQYVRKVSGYRKPSKVNEKAFMKAVDEISASTSSLLAALQANAAMKQHRHLVDIRNE
jgi:hypothetical protein